ncbi:MAG: Adenylate cyclase [Labilithrix sp.]|nr:Adenylate cyclase [Labilithrix sp.]
MSAVAASAAAAYGSGPAPSSHTFRTLLEQRRAEGRRLTLDDAIAVLVPVCVDLKGRHDRGEALYVHPSAITPGPDGLMRVHPALAVAPQKASDRAALAPELVKSNAPGNARASVFAVGAMLYEAVTGTPVGPGMRRPRDVDPSLPESLEMLLGKALVADPAHRPDDLGALANAMHHLAPMKSIPPPDADVHGLDHANGEPTDIRGSLLPPVDVQFSVAPPSNPSGVLPPTSSPSLGDGHGAAVPAPRVTRDPTRHLAQLKARLEADQRPRYVVNKDRMDHGPFSAVELLQQIASNQFVGHDILRDELTGVAQKIEEWDEFAPFSTQASLHRNIAQEKKDVARVESAEKKAGAAKFIIGGILAVALVAGGTLFLVKKVGERRDGSDLSDDPSAIDLSGGGSLKGGAKKAGAGGKGGGGGGGGGGFAGGGSYEAALNANNQEISVGGPKGGPDLTDAQLSGPMKNASFISGCGAPDSMKVTVKVAVKNGRAVGVSVYPNPPNPGVASCVDRHVRGLGWPPNAKMDFFTTTY